MKNKIKVCVINHYAKKNSNNNKQFVDYNELFPDPYKDFKKNIGTTGICRNTRNDSPQSKVFKYLNEDKDKEVYFLYCTDYHSKKYFTGLLKINEVYKNHKEYADKAEIVFPNNLEQQAVKYSGGGKGFKEFNRYKKRKKYPYIIGEWSEIVPHTGIKLGSVSGFRKEIKRKGNIKDLRSGTWSGRWLNFDSKYDLEKWISTLKT